MNRPLKIAALLLFAAVARADDVKPGEGKVTHLEEAHWIVPKVEGIPEGVMASPISQDPKSGESVGYGKIPAGTHFPSHWHSHVEHSILIHGKAKFTLGGKEHEIAPGSFVEIPAKMHHELWCLAGDDCVLFTHRGGPTDYHWDEH